MAITHLTSKLYKAKDNNQSTIGIFLDLSKAFDTVDHYILLQKLKHLGLDSQALLWFSSYLENRLQFVSFKGVNSSPLVAKCGVPQGSVLGPLLFLIYINDLSNVSDQLSKILFADDTSLFYSHQNPITLMNVVNKELEKIAKWFKINKLSLNIKKTNFILFGQSYKKNPVNITVLIDNVPITKVKSTRFLGVLIDENMSWKPQISFITSKIAKNIGIMGKNRYLLNSTVSLNLYYSMIYPFISYCNIAWASTHPTKLEPILCLQKRAVRIITLSAPRSHSLPLFRKLGILNIYQINKLQVAQFVFGSLNRTLPSFFNNFFTANNQFHSYPTRTAFQLRPPQSRTTSSQFRITYRGSRIWNSLPPHLVKLSSRTFKKSVKNILLNE